MDKAGHLVGGIVTIGLALKFNDFSFTNETKIIEGGLMSVGILVGAFLPDLDAEQSYFNSKTVFTPGIYKIIHEIFRGTFINEIFKHRGALLHSIWTIIIALIIRVFAGLTLSNAIIPTILTGMIFGIISHHILDMTTIRGLRYFYPLKIKIF